MGWLDKPQQNEKLFQGKVLATGQMGRYNKHHQTLEYQWANYSFIIWIIHEGDGKFDAIQQKHRKRHTCPKVQVEQPETKIFVSQLQNLWCVDELIKNKVRMQGYSVQVKVTLKIAHWKSN